VSPPKKAPGGMPRVLYVRCDDTLLSLVERGRVQIERDAGIAVGQADAVRFLLAEALAERGIK
jgi:hypothetical protein